MKFKKNSLALLTLAILILCLAAPAMAAMPGETASWGRTLSAPKISGNLVISDASILESYSVSPGEGPFSFESGSEEPGSWAFSVSGVVREGAAPGIYTVGYLDVNKLDREGKSLGYLYLPITVCVDAEPTAEPSQEPTAEPTAEPTPKPTPRPAPVSPFDLSALWNALREAESLCESDYSVSEWERLSNAVASAQAVLRAPQSQDEINTETEELTEAIESAVPLDRSALQEALDEADELLSDDAFGSLYAELMRLLPEAASAKESREQAQIDDQAGRLQAVLGKIEELRDDYKVVVEKEVVKEKLVEIQPEIPAAPEEPPIRKLWPWIFAVSAAGNIALAAVLIRRKKKAEEIPIAKFDMDDDL